MRNGLVILAFLGTASWIAWNWPTYLHFIRVEICIRGCEIYAAPTDQVVYEVHYRSGGAFEAYNHPKAIAFSAFPDCWNQLKRSLKSPPMDLGEQADDFPIPPLLLHEVRLDGGKPALLFITFDGWGSRSLWEFHYTIYTDGFQTTGETAVEIKPVEVTSLKFRAGSININDPRHFVIPFEINGQAGTIEGLTENRRMIELRVRDGPARP